MTIDVATQALLRSKLSSARGSYKQAAPVEIICIEPLTEADMVALQNPIKGLTTSPTLVKIRASHHRIAQLIAEGRRHTEIALICGISPQRISQLTADPAFQELMAFYVSEQQKVFVDHQQRLADLGTTALEELRDRLETSPEQFKTRELLDIVGNTYDRSVAPSKGAGKFGSGNGQGSPGLKVNINFTNTSPAVTIDGTSEVLNG